MGTRLALPEWSFQKKLIGGVLLICVLAIVTSLATFLAARELVGRMSQMSLGEGRDLAEVRSMQWVGEHLLADARGSLLTRDVRLATSAVQSSIQIRAMLDSLTVRAQEPALHAALDQVSRSERRHRVAFERAWALALRIPEERTRASRAMVIDSVTADGARLTQALVDLNVVYQHARQRELGPAQAEVTRSMTLMLGVSLSTAGLLVVLCLILIGVLGRSHRAQIHARRAAEHGQTLARASLTEVEAASHLKDEFLATVSHELRNPLAPILTWTQLLRSGTLDAEKTRRALEVIERNVLSQAQLIDDLVDVSRVVSGKFRLDVRPLDLVPIIKAAADAHGPASDAKSIRMQFVLDERAGAISGDSERLQQVMWNMISNAIKFTPKGGRVQVVLQRADSHVEITVSDNGIGIEPGFLPHVFEPFQQGTTGPMRRHTGLGLGLSIVRHIVELHGGEIIAQSDGLGKGSRFTIKFPILATVHEAREIPKRHPVARDSLAALQLGQLEGVRILVVDDEPNASEALVVLFQSCGAESRMASSAEEAIRILDGWLPDVLVSDIAMPDEDGYQLMKRVRSRPPGAGGLIPAVALTAHAKIEDRVTILKAGFHMYLSKPADPNELVAVVVSLARHRQKRPAV